MQVLKWTDPKRFSSLPTLFFLTEIKEDGTYGEPKNLDRYLNARFHGYSYHDLKSLPNGIHTIPCPRPPDPVGRKDFAMPRGRIQETLDGRSCVEFSLPFYQLRELVEFDPEDVSPPDASASPSVRIGIPAHLQGSLAYWFSHPSATINYPCEPDDPRRNLACFDGDGMLLPIVRGTGGYFKALAARLANPTITDEERERVLNRPVHVFLYLDDLDLASPILEQGVDVVDEPAVRIDAPEVIAPRPHCLERSAAHLFPDILDDLRNERVEPLPLPWRHSEFPSADHRNASKPVNRIQGWFCRNRPTNEVRLRWDGSAIAPFGRKPPPTPRLIGTARSSKFWCREGEPLHPLPHLFWAEPYSGVIPYGPPINLIHFTGQEEQAKCKN